MLATALAMLQLVILFVCATALSWALTGLLVRWLNGAAHQALPNGRSMHRDPTPVGGGLAIVAAVLVLTPLWSGPMPPLQSTVLAAAAMLSLVSAFDHYRPLWPLTRLAVQALAVAVPLAALPDRLHLLPDVPLWLERVGIGVAWLWLINLTNFMDGIDGIAGAQGAAVALGVAAMMILHFGAEDAAGLALALAIAGGCVGFLVWNWPPARIFMGDAGSVPIGYLVGWLLLLLAERGAWVAALVLPALFVADASLTLLRRVRHGFKPWQPHRSHFYQRAVLAGARPAHVVLLFGGGNAALVLVVIQASHQPIACLAAGAIITWLVFRSLSLWGQMSVGNAVRRTQPA